MDGGVLTVQTEDTRDSHYGETYALDYERKPLSRIKRLSRLIKTEELGAVADIGCGTGMLAEALNNQWQVFHGIDLSPEMLKGAKNRAIRINASNIYWHLEEITSFLNRYPETFNTIFALDFSEHVDDEEWLLILQSAHAALKSGGHMYLHTPNQLYLIELLKENGFIKQFPEHIAVRDAKSNVGLLRLAGFENVSVRYLSHYEFRQKPLWLLSYLPIIGKFFRARLFLTAQK
jgi:2-polyprenyl-6-hydroxyphenyl methylase/3-demethylubiquinone-9 3-methyltransferase